MILDNGAYQLKLGYMNMTSPYIKLDNVIVEREYDYICGQQVRDL